MEIQLYNKSEVSTLTVIREALETVLVNNMTDEELELELLTQMANASMLSGFKISETEGEVLIMARSIIKLMRRNKTNIRKDEIEIAFTDGIQEKWGKYYGLTALSFHGFISNYVKDEARKEALRIRNLPHKKSMPTEAEKFNIALGNALTGYNNVINNGNVGVIGSAIYDFLFRIRFFSITQEEIDEFMVMGNKAYYNDLETRKNTASDPLKKKEIRNRMDEFIGVMQQEGEKSQRFQSVVSAAKQIYIDTLFKGFLMDGLTVNELEFNIKKLR